MSSASILRYRWLEGKETNEIMSFEQTKQHKKKSYFTPSLKMHFKIAFLYFFLLLLLTHLNLELPFAQENYERIALHDE